MKKLISTGLIGVLCVGAFAQGVAPKQAFESLKKLAGDWEMKGPNGKALKVSYKVTGAGSALVETQMAGEADEMVSVYHMDGAKLVMTHYCAAGNQPTLVYKPGKSGKVLFFDFLSGSNMKPTDMHIHAAKIMLNSASEIQSDWVGYFKGKNAGTTSFNLKRVG